MGGHRYCKLSTKCVVDLLVWISFRSVHWNVSLWISKYVAKRPKRLKSVILRLIYNNANAQLAQRSYNNTNSSQIIKISSLLKWTDCEYKRKYIPTTRSVLDERIEAIRNKIQAHKYMNIRFLDDDVKFSIWICVFLCYRHESRPHQASCTHNMFFSVWQFCKNGVPAGKMVDSCAEIVIRFLAHILK